MTLFRNRNKQNKNFVQSYFPQFLPSSKKNTTELYLSPWSLLLTKYLIVLCHKERILKFYSYSGVPGISPPVISPPRDLAPPPRGQIPRNLALPARSPLGISPHPPVISPPPGPNPQGSCPPCALPFRDLAPPPLPTTQFRELSCI